MDPITALLYTLETTPDGGGAPVAGTGENTGASAPDSSAGTQNTDTGQGGGTPETIPYSRFKEVNDKYSSLRPFEELQTLGYDADSLRQLAEFEAGFLADPVSTWVRIAGGIENLPPDLKEAVQRHMGGSSSGDNGSSASKSQDGEDEPASVKELREKLNRLEETEVQRQQREASEASNRMLDNVLASWRAADEEAGVKSPSEDRMLTFIAAHARGATNPQDIVERARGEYLALREEALSSAIPQPGGNAAAPRPVPASGAPINADGPPKTLAEASLRAKARLQATQERS